MGRIFMCKKCHHEWEEAPHEKRPAILDEADYCVHCLSYDVAPKMNGTTDRVSIVQTIVEAQACFNKAMELIKPIKEAINHLEEMRGKLYEKFDELTTDDEWEQKIDIDMFYSFKTKDEIDTVINAATSHIEE